MPDTHRLKPSKSVKLAKLSTRGKDFHDDREQAEEEFHRLRGELADYQQRLYAEGRQKLLIVLQAMDAGGKDGTIRRVFEGVNPQGVRVSSFKKPTDEELARDFLWRIHRKVPAAGMIRIFNRSHYEDVLVVRVHELVPESVWRPRYEQINQFEELLTSSGTTIVKIFLHISPEEQLERFQARLDDPRKHYKFSVDDLEKRKHWDQYMEAFEELLERCSTRHAPWYVIPADQKWYRNLAIARILIDTFQRMNPQFPDTVHDISSIKLQ